MVSAMSLSVKDLQGAAAAPVITPVQEDRPKRELRVLQVFSVLGMGGAETWLMSLLKYFRDAEADLPVRVRFDILLTGAERAIFDDEAIAFGARLFYVRFTRKDLFGFMREFRQILAGGNYDAIHDHQDYMAGLHFLMGAGRLPPIRIAHVHNPIYRQTIHAKGPFRRLTTIAGKQLIGRLATHVMGTSRQILTEYGLDEKHLPNVNSGVAHCGFDVAKYEGDREQAHDNLCREFGWRGSAKVILFVGRLEGDQLFHFGRLMNHKNPEFALDVVKKCIGKDQNVRLVMVGAGEVKRKEFEATVREWGLDGKIRFVGVRHDVPRLMLGADLLLFPSLAEGLGMVVVEAQAAGLRVLASDTTPRECLVVHQMVEFLPLTASPDQWADQAVRLLNADDLDAGGCKAAVRYSSFSIENSAARLLGIYASAVKPIGQDRS